MKRTGTIIAAMLFAFGAAAQNPTSYFMEGSTFRSQFNPAFAPLRGYVNIPGLGGVEIGTSGNLSLGKLLYPRNGRLVTLLDGSVTASEALAGLHKENFTGTQTRINLIGFGAFTRNRQNFWSFDLNLRATTDARLPYSLFEFLKRGSGNAIRDIGVTADSYLEAGFSYSFPVARNKVYIGIRGKFLMGMARARLHYDRFDVSLEEDRWQVDARGTLEITSAGIGVETGPDAGGGPAYHMGDISLKPTKPAGYGFAMDLGATYDILPELQASLAVTDLGFICWGKRYNSTGHSVRELTFTGETIPSDGTEQPAFDLDVLEFRPAAARSSARMLQASVNAGIEYRVWQRRIGFGLLYTARIREFETLHQLTGSVNFHAARWFSVTGSYSVVDNQACAVGFALNLHPSWINFYIATDILTARHTPQFIPIRQNAMHLSVGIGIPIGKRGCRGLSASCGMLTRTTTMSTTVTEGR